MAKVMKSEEDASRAESEKKGNLCSATNINIDKHGAYIHIREYFTPIPRVFILSPEGITTESQTTSGYLR